MTEEELQQEIKSLDLSKKILDLKIQLAECRINQIRLNKEFEEKEGNETL